MTNLRDLFLALALLCLTAACTGGDGTADTTQPIGDTAVDAATTDTGGAVDVTPDGADVALDGADDAVDGDVPDDVPPPPPGGYPSPELLVRIVSPGPGPSSAAPTGVVTVQGVLFGEAARVRLLNETTGLSRTVEPPSTFWSASVALVEGNNELRAVAENEDGSVSRSDAIIVTHNPGFAFAGHPRVAPLALFSGEETTVVVSIPLGRTDDFTPGSMRLERVNARYEPVADLGAPNDDGAVENSGDELANDGWHTATFSFTCSAGSPLRVRAAVEATSGAVRYDAHSPVVTLPCVARVTSANCAEARQTAEQLRTQFDASLETGLDRDAARDAAEGWLRGRTAVQSFGASPDGAGLWFALDSGLLGAVELAPDSQRGAGDGAPKSATASSGPGRAAALLLDPWGDDNRIDDELPAIADLLSVTSCPAFPADGPYQAGYATLARFRELADYGLVAAAAHGGVHFGDLPEALRPDEWRHGGAQEIVWSGETIDCSALLDGPLTCADDEDCPDGMPCIVTVATDETRSGLCWDQRQVDAAQGRLVVGDSTWGMTPSFFAATPRPLPRSLVYVGACGSLRHGALASSLYAAGAAGVWGFSARVTNDFATAEGEGLFQRLVIDEATAADAVSDETDPTTDATLRYFGDPSVALSDATLQNAGFEDELVGWRVDGHVRTLEQVGALRPVTGRRMAAVSTGLGLSGANGALSQTFCVPWDANTLRFYWRVVSDELDAGCGSVNQDRFRAVLRGVHETVTAVDVTIDDLCPPAACAGCGASHTLLSPAEVALDQGGGQQTEWREAIADVGAFAGNGPVELTLTVTDRGDSLYDTLVLIDALVIE